MKTTGRHWENIALTYLLRNGLKLVTRNYRCRLGEVDLIMTDGQILCFIEVRYRLRRDYGGATASVDAHKQRKLCRAAGQFLARNGRWASGFCRFDVISISGRWRPSINWIKNAFECC